MPDPVTLDPATPECSPIYDRIQELIANAPVSHKHAYDIWHSELIMGATQWFRVAEGVVAVTTEKQDRYYVEPLGAIHHKVEKAVIGSSIAIDSQDVFVRVKDRQVSNVVDVISTEDVVSQAMLSRENFKWEEPPASRGTLRLIRLGGTVS